MEHNHFANALVPNVTTHVRVDIMPSAVRAFFVRVAVIPHVRFFGKPKPLVAAQIFRDVQYVAQYIRLTVLHNMENGTTLGPNAVGRFWPRV